MRTLSLLAPAALILALGACASTPADVTPPPAGFDASATQFEGWARVADGEIRLYARERDLTQGFPPTASAPSCRATPSARPPT